VESFTWYVVPGIGLFFTPPPPTPRYTVGDLHLGRIQRNHVPLKWPLAYLKWYQKMMWWGVAGSRQTMVDGGRCHLGV